MIIVDVECMPWKGAEISDRALQVNGFTRDELVDHSKPHLYRAIKEFIAWVKGSEDYIIGGQNVGGFDIKFFCSLLLIARV